MKRTLAWIGAGISLAGVALAYSPSTGAWDKPYLVLLVPGIILNLWAMLDAE
ncbi:hypothetical protein [Burkholderia stagnalis]|uniref:hypothetical protein n=1 Tax=Burkholderia stagnalis TaxID=1503054 RepID=UPI000A911411|nr:hypothetical protein [Burkholderia stagnalis]